MNISKFLYHSTKFHHIDRSTCNLCGNIIFAFFSDQVLSDNTKESAHVRVWFNHWFESLHLIDFDELILQLIELLKLQSSNLAISLELFERGFWSLLRAGYCQLIWLGLGFLRLLLIGFLLLEVLMELMLKPDHLLSDMNQTRANMCLSGLLESLPILHALIRFRSKDFAARINAYFLLIDVLRLLMVRSSSEFVES